MFELGLPDGGIGGAGMGGRNGGDVAKLVESSETGQVVNAQIGWTVGTDASDGSQGFRARA